MKAGSDRLTFRNVSPELKRAIKLYAEQKGTSMEKAVIEILEESLKNELWAIQVLDEASRKVQPVH